MEGTRVKIRLCSVDDVEEGSAILVETDDLILAVYQVEGAFFVTDDTCTHGPGSLSEGDLCGHVIECDFHGGQFDIRTGAVVAAPCMIPLKTYKVLVEDQSIFIEV